ncbi:hypothetical protein IFM89_017387 [Coptis chinensis]|uniref:Lipoxygenase n=1 Tax=Coptis chinensis TaxID=261450 RepID=A0A835HMS8_9MAGN|nr:hypothetical protein IFM89_017387 [Coptis chinensis]
MFSAQPTNLLQSGIITPSSTRSLNDAIFGTRKSAKIRSRNHKLEFSSQVIGVSSIRAVIRSGDKNVGTKEVPMKDSHGALTSKGGEAIDVKLVMTIRNKMKEKLTEKIKYKWESFINGIGQGILIKLISEEIDPATNSGKTIDSSVRGWLPKQSDNTYIAEYATNFRVPSDFGCPGAVLITNLQSKEFYLMEIVVHGFNEGPIFFPANSWIHSRDDNPESRIIFKNKAYLPSQTPAGIKDLRREDLLSNRGNGKGERKEFDRIYDYAPYNDLGNPDKDDDLARPVLAGEEMPYPRRCRTGRPPTKSDPCTESRIEKPDPVYVPRDETFEEVKQAIFSAGRLKSLFHNLLPSLAATLSSSEIPFNCFTDIDKLYNDGVLLTAENQKDLFGSLLLTTLIKKVMRAGERLLKYDVPAIVLRDRFSWLRDNEFARQTLAGVNPVNIEALKEFPIISKLDPADYGPPESLITKELIDEELDGMSVDEAIENNRLFILDFHDLLLPFIKKINSLPGRKSYASRTVFFYNKGVLHPIAIELSVPPTPSSSINKRVYTHGHDATKYWIWKLAKAHVCSNDAGVHQLVNHWLRTHACMEPYIIATHRQLSAMHPIYKLLHPHMRYTLEINAVARQNLINGGGIIEECFSPGKYAMELSSAAYKSMWRFDMEALPADLIRSPMHEAPTSVESGEGRMQCYTCVTRGVSTTVNNDLRGVGVEDSSMPGGVRLLIEDYPYAADGLLVWSAIKDWVEAYVAHFYLEHNSVSSDVELQAWWDEIKNKGHYDKQNETWWPKLQTKKDLSGILTTMVWIASGQHAAINFGQYPFGGLQYSFGLISHLATTTFS